jgi:nucleotide-binding universal stress UspA family protein
MFSRVLVAVEDGPVTRPALRLAARLVARRGGRLRICAVVDREQAAPPNLPVTFRPRFNADLARAAERAVERAAAVARAAGVRADTKVLEGHVVEELVTAARRFRAQLLVMAPRRRGRLSAFVLGSRTQAVVNRSPCPILLVPPRRSKA